MNAYFKHVPLKEKIQGQNRRLDPCYGAGSHQPEKGMDAAGKEPPGKFSVVGKLENSVSMLQVSRTNIEKIRNWLMETREFLEQEVSYIPRSTIPGSVINSFITERLNKIKMTSEAAAFQSKALLNGNSGVKGASTTQSLRFVRGSARVISSGEGGYPVSVIKEASPSCLLGSERISSEVLKAESMIALADESHEIRYKIKADEDADSLVTNLQGCMSAQGLDVSVYRTKDNHLLFRHNQLGAAYSFKGMSYQSRLVSKKPGKFSLAGPGEDVSGTINSEPADGNGGFLIGRRGNPRTDGLIVFFNGRIEYSGQIAGYVQVQQNGIQVPLDLTGKQIEILSLPSLEPRRQAVGVANHSGFSALSSIHVNTETERLDALRLILWSITDIEYLLKDLRQKENYYVDLAIELLRSSMRPKVAGEDLLFLSKDKAGEMAEQLKTMLTPAMAM